MNFIQTYRYQLLLLLFSSILFVILLTTKQPLLTVYFFGALLGIIVTELLTFNKRWLFYFCIALVPLSQRVEVLDTGMAISFPSELFITFLSGALLSSLMRTPLDTKVLRHPLTILLIIDTVWLIFTSMTSSMPDVSFKRVIMRINFILFAYIIVTLWNKDLRNLLKVQLLYAVGLLPVIYLVFLNHAHYDFSPLVTFSICRPYYADHTIYGACIAFILPSLIYVSIYRRDFLGPEKFGGILIVTTLLVFVMAEIMAFSRAAWLSLIVAAMFFFLLRIRLKAVYFLVGFLLFVGTLFWQQENIFNYLKQNETVSNDGNISNHISSVGNVNTDASNLERLNRWYCAVEMFKDKPITGFGPGTYQFNYGHYQTSETKTYISTDDGDRGNAHSEYFTYLSESGLPGAVFFLLIVVASIRLGIKLVYEVKSAYIRNVAICNTLALITFYFHGLFNSFIDQEKMAVLVFSSLAVLVSIDIYHRNSEEMV